MKIPVISALFACITAFAQAQPDSLSKYFEMSLFEIQQVKVITASKQEQQISEIPASVIVITRTEIEQFGYSTLNEVLNSITGYYSFNNLGVDIYGVRGFCKEKGTNFVILVNGIKIDDTKILKFYGIPVEAIDKIEVVRGPMAVIYGNNAFFGAINIITNSSVVNSATVSYGSLNTKQINGRVAAENEGVKLAVNVALSSSDGRNIPLDAMMQHPETLNEPLFGGALGKGLALPLSAQQTKGYLGKTQNYFDFIADLGDIKFNAVYTESNNGWYYYYPSVDEGSQFKNTNFSALGAYKKEFSSQFSFETKLRYVRFNSNHDYHHLFEGFYGVESDTYNEIEAEVNAFWVPTDKLNITAGLQYENMLNYTNYQDVPIANISNMAIYYINKGDNGVVYSAFLQAEFNILSTLKLVAGARVEQAMPYGLTIMNYQGSTPPPAMAKYAFMTDTKEKDKLSVAPRFAAIYTINENNIVKLLYGKAVKRPDYVTISDDLSDIIRGEKNSGYSKSEFMQTFEINYSAVLAKNFAINTSFFYNNLDNLLVERNEIVSNILRAWWANAGTMETKGVEATVVVGNKAKFYSELSAVYQKTTDKSVNINASFSPDLLAYLKVYYQINSQFSVSLLGNFVDEVNPYFNYKPIFDANGIATGNYIGRTALTPKAYFTTDLNIRYSPNFIKGTYANLHCTNLLNTTYYYPSFAINNAWADKGALGFGRLINFSVGMKF